MTSLDQQCLSTSLIVAQCVIDNSHWRAFGYYKRPSRGKVFQFFVRSDKLELETVLLRELWAASFGRIFFWALTKNQFVFQIDFIARLLDLCIDGLKEPFWPVLRFLTTLDAITFLEKACKEYGENDFDNTGMYF